MLLFDALSPGPRTVRMYLLEKKLSIPLKNIDVFKGENRQMPYLDCNPAGQVPALKLGDGSCLSETVAIWEYLEEKYPNPSLIGTTPEERAETRQWQRRLELNITENIHNAYHYAEGIERFKTRIPVAPEAAVGLKQVAQDRIRWIDEMIAGSDYIVGTRFTVADIWLYCWLDFGISVNQPYDSSLKHVDAWFTRVEKRPSALNSLHPNWSKVGIRG
ncbi:glutathione S-transferase family protein [Nitrosococcus watsonii]|uniref:Glutathione S-transferase domain protein n=1 Tax=Nitrosococcus watsoni (strain C-113) TaxID=105559 RepID=D8K812_NITWC|nr:glutathione S-transferase family protein [Nitrosococcus watsonii]ADJ27007.1 Glutathione S-transferase domain protein [Nitrosococcus watsonii C-113]